MQVRLARVTDAKALWEAEVATARQPGVLLSRPDELRLGAFEQRIKELTQRGCYVIAEAESGLLGHVLLEPMALEALRHVFRLTIVVHPGKTGRGVGSALMRHIQEWAEQHTEVHKVELLVRSTNARAVAFYERHGFEVEGRLRERVRLPNGELIDDVSMAWFPRRQLAAEH